jgi:hypothetical protein
MKRQGNDCDELAMELILWGRSRDSLPGLSRKKWQQVAAGIYRNSVMAESRQLNPTGSPSSYCEDWYRDHSVRWTRLLCGALAVRALEKGWKDLADQWGSRYWTRADGVDHDDDLEVAMDHVLDIEDAIRAAIADSPKR